MNRGDHREPVFRRVHDRQLFLDTLGEAFPKELLAQMGQQARAEHYAEEIRESAEAKANLTLFPGLDDAIAALDRDRCL